MTEHERDVLDLAEAWFDSWESEPDEDLHEERALYQSVAAMRAARAPYVPVDMFGELSVQIMLESQRQERTGAHLIPITMVEADTIDGELVERDYQYLETNGG
jgi:hypothetical protein